MNNSLLMRLLHQLRGVLDEAVEHRGKTKKFDGLVVVLRAVRATAPKGFTVTMLKPGKVHCPHSGVLFLDNPIGRASAGYLLDLQRETAAALGVRLVYTTGLFDEEALAGFPLIIRLRNDADLRAGRKYLSVHERVVPHLGSLPEPDGTSVLTATRITLPERRHDETN